MTPRSRSAAAARRPPVPFAWVVIGLVAATTLVAAVQAIATDGEPRAGVDASPSVAPSPSATIPPLPRCRLGDKLTAATGYQDWAATILDTTLRLPRGYAPAGLISAGAAGFDEGAQFRVRPFLIPALSELREAAEAAGHPVELIAAYRSYDDQASLFRRRVEELGEQAALSQTARAGHSEHQLGTTVDFKTPGQPDVTEAWGATGEGKWMAANAHLFGFVLSYPLGKEAKTCYGYEPWHFRYLGRELAGEIHSSGLTVREFLWRRAHGAGREGPA